MTKEYHCQKCGDEIDEEDDYVYDGLCINCYAELERFLGGGEK